jgi:hypothetical protein
MAAFPIGLKGYVETVYVLVCTWVRLIVLNKASPTSKYFILNQVTISWDRWIS